MSTWSEIESNWQRSIHQPAQRLDWFRRWDGAEAPHESTVKQKVGIVRREVSLLFRRTILLDRL